MSKILSTIFVTFMSFFLTATLSGCGDGDVLYVDKAVVNVSPVEGNPSAGYFEVHGGRQDVELVSVVADDVLRMEMHETTQENGVSSMKPISKVKIPAKSTVAFKPGGKHLMVWGVGSLSRKRGTMPMTFIFSNDVRIAVDAKINLIGGNKNKDADAKADKAAPEADASKDAE